MARKNEKTIRTLGDESLKSAVGGLFIDPITKMPGYMGPKMHVPASIAQGDTLDNTLTFDQLP